MKMAEMGGEVPPKRTKTPEKQANGGFVPARRLFSPLPLATKIHQPSHSLFKERKPPVPPTGNQQPGGRPHQTVF